MKTLYVLLFLSISQNIFALPAGTKGENGNFKISDKSLDHLGVKFQKLENPGPWTIPSDSLVKIKLTEGVYRRYDGEITFVIVNKSGEENNHVLIESPDLEPGDEVAISGAMFLRMAETDLNSETVDNCSH